MRESFTKRAALQHRTTRMIVVVTAVFGVCNTLPFVLNIWEAFQPDDFWDNVQKPALLVTDFSNCLVILNSSSTFLIYLVYCTSYRKLFLAMFKVSKAEVSSEPHVTEIGVSEYPIRPKTQLRTFMANCKYTTVLEKKSPRGSRLSSRKRVDISSCDNVSKYGDEVWLYIYTVQCAGTLSNM